MAEPIQVKVRDCPTGLHNGEGDWVLLAPTLSLVGGLAAERDLRAIGDDVPIPDGSPKDVVERLTAEREAALTNRWIVTFIRHGAIGWNLHDEDGTALPFSVDELLADYNLSRVVADEAANLYTDSVLRPLRIAPPAKSPSGRTSGSTSPRRARTRRS